jgi:outer membrane protein assembly factor BamA
MKKLQLLLAVLVLVADTAPALAQDAAPWRLSYFPYFTVTPNDGLMGIARAIWARQAGWGERIVNTNSVSVEAGLSTKNAWLGRATWSNPTLADGWRIKARTEIGHTRAFGNPVDSIEHDRALAWVDLTRRIKGPVHLALRGQLRRDQLDPGNPQTDFSIRGGLVVDLRDREYEVNNGVLLEGGAITGTAGSENGYQGLYAMGRAYWHPLLPLRVSGRAGWREPIEPRGQLVAAIEFPAWEDPFDILGGHRSHRGLATSQLLGDGVAFAGAELHLDVINVGELGAITILAFVDGAKQLWHSPGPILESQTVASLASTEVDWVVGVGGGVALRVMRQATLTITAAGGDGETRWYVGSGFSW